MGAGGKMPVPATNGEIQRKHNRAPHSKPPFTLSEIKKVVPPHCFKRSLVRSFSYVVTDIFLISLFYYIASSYFHLIPKPFSYFAWPVYWYFQGCVITGIWVLAHECGHHAFSDYPWLDDTVGFILHSAIVVPYFSWKYSHRRHHSNTNSIERDEVFVPKPKTIIPWYYTYIDNPPGRVMILAVTLLLGWPLYLACNVAGRPYDRYASHFDPYSPIYSNRERLQIFISDAGVLTMSYVLYRIALVEGFSWIICYFTMPLLVTNAFLVSITYLQHTHPSLPHYDSSGWEWLKGALATVDRDYGILNKVFHHITDTHVAHHLFSNMPHYHATEATEAIKPMLGEYYQSDSLPFYKALWREGKECLYVQEDEDTPDRGVYWYKNKY